MSRKSSINKNSFYRSKAIGKLPDYLPNKPTVVGSRGQNPTSSGYMKSSAHGVPNKLPGLSSGGIAGNGMKPKVGLPNQPVYKYGGLGGGLGGGVGGSIGAGAAAGRNPYQMNYQTNSQGEQGSIGSSGSRNARQSIGSPNKDFLLPQVSNKKAFGAMMSRGKQSSSGGAGNSR